MPNLPVQKRGLPVQKHDLPVQKREENGASAKALRRSGSIPAVVYGAHNKAMSIAVDARAFEKVFHETGEASIVSLTGIGAPISTLIHEIQYDPITNNPSHIDFYAVTKGQKVEVGIPLSFIGESPAVGNGANLVKVLHEIEVEADPMNLPHEIEVDISVLKEVGDQIRAKDLKLPSGVVLIAEPEDVVALTQEVEVEKEEAPADISQVEVEKKGKEEEGSEEIRRETAEEQRTEN